MKKLTGFFLALAFSALALLPTSADAHPSIYYVCVESCFDCWHYPGPCQNAFCQEFAVGCEETFGIACRCS